MIVSTAYRPTTELAAQAERLAKELNCAYIHRRKFSVVGLRARYKDSSVLLVTDAGLKWYGNDSDEPLFFHPSIALLRIKRLLQGETDVMLEHALAAPGDRVLDCTAGLGSDSIVFSHRVGESGSVTALESEPVLARLIREGLMTYTSEVPEVNEAMRRVNVVCADHLGYLQSLPGRSVDIVYFDPMFRQPIDASCSISPLRHVANAEALTEQAIAEACRVAHKTVVLKENKDSDEFERLGFHQVMRSNSKTAYGVIMINEPQ